MRLLLLCLGLMAPLGAAAQSGPAPLDEDLRDDGAVQAEHSASPPRRDEDPRDDPARPPALHGSFGVGLATLSIGQRHEFGVGLGVAAEHRFNAVFGIRFGLDCGMTRWERLPAWFETPQAITRATAQAFTDVAHWNVGAQASGWAPLAGAAILVAAVLSWAFLSFGFIVAGLCYLATPFAATSFLDFTVSGAAHLARGPVDLHLEAGVGTALVFDPVERVHLGFGPMVGAGVRLSRVTLTATALWIPPVLQTGGGSGALTTTAKLGIAF